MLRVTCNITTTETAVYEIEIDHDADDATIVQALGEGDYQPVLSKVHNEEVDVVEREIVAGTPPATSRVIKVTFREEADEWGWLGLTRADGHQNDFIYARREAAENLASFLGLDITNPTED